jgi:hypothetical protein
LNKIILNFLIYKYQYVKTFLDKSKLNRRNDYKKYRHIVADFVWIYFFYIQSGLIMKIIDMTQETFIACDPSRLKKEELQMESRIRIKLGQIEVEYEGSDAFIKGEIQGLLGQLAQLQPQQQSDSSQASLKSGGSGGGQSSLGTTSSIVARLGDSTGTGLVLAACAHLTFVKQQERFERQVILDEMKTATGYYKRTFNNNFSSYLGRLVKAQKLLELSKGLTATMKQEIESRINN